MTLTGSVFPEMCYLWGDSLEKYVIVYCIIWVVSDFYRSRKSLKRQDKVESFLFPRFDNALNKRVLHTIFCEIMNNLYYLQH
mgnify:CR=1 FL=1